MEGIINDTGHLAIFRNKEKFQCCPKQNDDTRCGDWCPLFQEEQKEGNLKVTLNCAPVHTEISIKRDERVY